MTPDTLYRISLAGEPLRSKRILFWQSLDNNYACAYASLVISLA